jgi:hypothetical protein
MDRNAHKEEFSYAYIHAVAAAAGYTDDWLVHLNSELLLRYCGYWVSLAGQPTTQNAKTVTVHVPRENLFSPEALKRLLLKV